jgi:hypothetical protein
MWQIWSLTATGFACCENITDKRAMRSGGGAIDADVASFLRVLLWCLLVIPVSAAFGAHVSWYFNVWIVLFGLASAGLALSYTQVMRRVEASTLAVLTYIGPLIFLAIDAISGHHFTASQVAGLVGLVAGGIVFVANGRIRADRTTLALLGVMFAYSGSEGYYLQYVNRTAGNSGISFFASVWVWAGAFLLLNLIVRGKYRLLGQRDAGMYAMISALGKSFDAGASLFSGKVLTAVSVSQFAAMQAVYPPMALVLTVVAQRTLGIDLGEPLDSRTLWRKFGAAALIVVSARLL